MTLHRARRARSIGLAGLEGSGRRDAAGRPVRDPPRRPAGEVRYPDGARAAALADREPRRRGISLVPADRRRQGLMLDRSVVRNITLVTVGARRWRVAAGSGPREMLAAARRQIDRLRIKVGDPQAPVGSLSGGNQQKVVLGRWLEAEPRADAARRPDARRGHRREARDLPAHPAARRRGPHRPVPLHGAARAGRPRRPHPHLLPGPADARARRAARRTTTPSSTPSTPVAGRPASGRDLDRHRSHRRSAHDPTRVHDAPQARRPRRVPRASTTQIWPELVAEIERQGIAQHDDLRERPGAVPLLGDRRRGGLGPAVAHRRSTTSGAS